MVMDHHRRILEDATTIELVDWPHQEVPAVLHLAGYQVLGHEPDGFKVYEVEDAAPVDPGDGRAFPLEDGRVLVSRPLEVMPESVDIVSVFRPPAEQHDLLRQAIEAGARVFWVHPGVETAPDLAALTEAAGMTFVDGVSIVDAVRALG
jgi:predicted CoA-binding protein